MAPSLPKLPPALRSIDASLVRACSRLVPAAADTVLRLSLAVVWLLFAGKVVMDVARIIGAEDSPTAVAASTVVVFCDRQFLNALFLIAWLFNKRVGKYDADEVKGPVPRRMVAAWKELKCRTVMLGLYACAPFFLLVTVGALLLITSRVKGSRREEIGFLVAHVGILGKNALVCFVIIPTAAMKVWRVTRPGWGSGSTTTFSVEINP